MKRHNDSLPGMLQAYADERGLEYHLYSPYHMRLIYEPRVTLDCWTTGKYWIMQCKYGTYTNGIADRGSEKGWLPSKQTKLYDWLDQLFFIVEIKESKYHAE